MIFLDPQSPHGSSLRRRAFLALMLAVGFYTLALVMMGVVILLVVAMIASGHFVVQILLLAIVAFFAILSAIIPRPDRFHAPWPRLMPEAHPRLFAKLNDIAARAEQRMPDEVYILPELNAWVMDRGRGGRRRVMGIGLPLIMLLDEAQFTAVIAHEFGHYYGGDTRLGPWIHRTRAAIGRTLQNLNTGASRLVQAPFLSYGRMFMGVTMGVSREQEYTADRFAASLVGPDAVASSLKRIAGYAPGINMYWSRLALPSVTQGFHPPLCDGIAQLFASERVSANAQQYVDKVIEVAEEDPFDTHPCLRDRVAALQGLAPREQVGTAPAMALLSDLPHIEAQLVAMWVGAPRVKELETITWDDVSERVFVAYWSALREHNRAQLELWTVEEIGAVFYHAGEFVAEVRDAHGKFVDPEYQPGLLFSICVAAISLALCNAGWKHVALPDFGPVFVRGDERADVAMLLHSVADGSASQREWVEACGKLGIAGMKLCGEVSPTGPGNRWTPVLRTMPSIQRFEGGNGASVDTATIVHGVSSENELDAVLLLRLREWYGVEGSDWRLVGRTRQEHKGRSIEVVEFVLKNGRKRSLYFDCTEFRKREEALNGGESQPQ